jgi:hypothetical protein
MEKSLAAARTYGVQVMYDADVVLCLLNYGFTV